MIVIRPVKDVVRSLLRRELFQAHRIRRRYILKRLWAIRTFRRKLRRKTLRYMKSWIAHNQMLLDTISPETPVTVVKYDDIFIPGSFARTLESVPGISGDITLPDTNLPARMPQIAWSIPFDKKLLKEADELFDKICALDRP